MIPHKYRMKNGVNPGSGEMKQICFWGNIEMTEAKTLTKPKG